ncbi:unnamed protein product [Schistocephalus solidus]|uniref:DUF7041 domain-containing protein n=1 Tax=Schistocephalus solidus TaxID=70667 RepID=A0A3P7F067_SCHSO|nr:unnamed protein product [Schistocephalus solidus]
MTQGSGGGSLCGTPTPWDPSQVWWYAQGRLRPRQPPALSPASGLLDSVMTPGSVIMDDAISAVSLSLPDFSAVAPELYFLRIESNLHTANITKEVTKFHRLVQALPLQVLSQVPAVIQSPPTNQPYTQLKAALLREEGLGDRKPTELHEFHFVKPPDLRQGQDCADPLPRAPLPSLPSPSTLLSPPPPNSTLPVPLTFASLVATVESTFPTALSLKSFNFAFTFGVFFTSPFGLAICFVAIDWLPQVDMSNDQDLPPSLPDTIRTVQNISSGKALGSDAILLEVYNPCGLQLMAEHTPGDVAPIASS